MSELPILPPLTALILFAVWSLLLVSTIGIWRVSQLLTGRVPKGGFTPGAPHGGDAYWRMNRAHMNSVENLPVFGALVLSGVVLQVQKKPPLGRTVQNPNTDAPFFNPASSGRPGKRQTSPLTGSCQISAMSARLGILVVVPFELHAVGTMTNGAN